jgi:hypothetical protein
MLKVLLTLKLNIISLQQSEQYKCRHFILVVKGKVHGGPFAICLTNSSYICDQRGLDLPVTCSNSSQS